MNLYSKAPVISRLNPRGIVAEGVIPDRETNLTFNHAVESYGHIVPPNRYMTGGQWIENIEAQYDVKDPRHAAVVRAIKTVMLVDEFKDDHIVVKKGSAEAVYRGRAAECQTFITNNGGARLSKFEGAGFDVIPTKAVDGDLLLQADENTAIRYLADNFATGGFRRAGFFAREQDSEARERHIASGQALSLVNLGLPSDVVYYPNAADRSNALVRILDLLKVVTRSPVGKALFTAEQHADRASCIDLIAVLCNLHGYGTLVTSAKGIRLNRPPAKEQRQNMLHPAMVESSIMDFVESLEEAGWDGESDLFVCRPASAYNTLMNIKPYESLVHNELIGWRIPRGVVHQLADELHEIQQQKHDVRAHGERAA